MSNINAAIGLVQLGKFEKMNRRKIEVAKQYDAAFENVENVTLLKNDGYREIGLFVYILRIKSRRNELMDFLGKQGVASGIHYIPSHVFSFYRKEGIHLPVTEQIYGEILTLPLFPDITDSQVNQVIDTVTAGMSGR